MLLPSKDGHKALCSCECADNISKSAVLIASVAIFRSISILTGR